MLTVNGIVIPLGAVVAGPFRNPVSGWILFPVSWIRGTHGPCKSFSQPAVVQRASTVPLEAL
jgi:hypothetical protein